jgi:uncharacterized membrane protein
MAFIQQPAYIITVLLLLVVFSEWLAKKTIFRYFGSVLIIIIAAAILANIGLIPTSTNAPPVYSRIFDWAAPLGIFFLLLEVKLKDLEFAGLPMLMMFLVGSAATIIGVVVGYWLFSPQHHQIDKSYAVAGMFTGTYIGGSANLNAVAISYGMNENGTLFAAINAVDNILTTFWLFMTMLLPPILFKLFPRKKKSPPALKSQPGEEPRSIITQIKTETSITDIALLLALGFGTLFFSRTLSEKIPGIPSILTLTTIALILAQLPFIQKLKGGKMIGLLLIMMFLAVIGAYCDIPALLKSGEAAGTLLLWDSALVLIHAVVIFSIGGLLKQDWDIVSIASNANIGGATSAPVCAASLGRPDLQLPGLLAGSVGNAIGTYLGIMVAEFLK